MKSENFDLVEEIIEQHGWPVFTINAEDGYALHHNEEVGYDYGIFHADWDIPGGEEVRLDDMTLDYTECVVHQVNIADMGAEEVEEALTGFFFKVEDYFANL